MTEEQRRKRSSLPFSLDLTRRNTLAAQMADALRQAIASGRYRPGETLPTVRAWAKLLGVSMRVPEAVIPQLVKEGLIVARPRHGCVVAPRGASLFRGHVLLVMPPEAFYRNANIMSGMATRRLEDAGYLVSYVRANVDARGRHDFSRLRLALRQSVDLAVFIYQNASAARCAKECGVPFVTISKGRIAGAVGHVCQSNTAAFKAAAADLLANGVRTVEIIAKSDIGREWEPTEIFSEAGLKVIVSRVPVKPKMLFDERRVENLMTGARDFFAARFARKSRPRFADAIFFTDDFLAQGAVPVLLAHGVRIPYDFPVVTMANCGFGPVYPFPFARVEVDSYENGTCIAAAILTYFDKGAFPDEIVFSPRYVPAW